LGEDDMDLDGFDIPQTKTKEISHNTAPDLALNRHVSFGPITQYKKSPEKELEARKVENNKEEDEEIIDTTPLKMTKKTPSIASFLKNSLKSGSSKGIMDFDTKKASLFASQSYENSISNRKPAKTFKMIQEEEKGMDDMGLGEFDDLDDMDIDDIPEPTFK
jgi:hypothetical protein